MGILPTNFKKEVLSKFKEIKNELSKDVIVFSTPDKTKCPNCIIDATGVSVKFNSAFVTPTTIYNQVITPTSYSRGRCPICHNEGFLKRDNKKLIKCLVRWNPSQMLSDGSLNRTPAGIEGRNVVQIKSSKCYYELLRDCLYITVDGIKCEQIVPPVYRSIGSEDIMVIGYFTSVDPGKSTRE